MKKIYYEIDPDDEQGLCLTLCPHLKGNMRVGSRGCNTMCDDFIYDDTHLKLVLCKHDEKEIPNE